MPLYFMIFLSMLAAVLLLYPAVVSVIITRRPLCEQPVEKINNWRKR